MEKSVRAKMVVGEVKQVVGGAYITLGVVGATSEENKAFFKYTPSGSLSLGLVAPEHAEKFKPGAEFYIDLIPVAQG